MKTALQKVVLVEPDYYSREFARMLLLRDWRTALFKQFETCSKAHNFVKANRQSIDVLLISDTLGNVTHLSNKRIFQLDVPILFVGDDNLHIELLNCLIRNRQGGYVAKNDIEYSLAQAISLITQGFFVVSPTIKNQIQASIAGLGHLKLINLFKSKEIVVLKNHLDQEIAKLFIVYNFSREMIARKHHISVHKVARVTTNLYKALNLEAYLEKKLLFEDDILNLHLDRLMGTVSNNQGSAGKKMKQEIAFHILTTLESAQI